MAAWLATPILNIKQSSSAVFIHCFISSLSLSSLAANSISSLACSCSSTIHHSRWTTAITLTPTATTSLTNNAFHYCLRLDCRINTHCCAVTESQHLHKCRDPQWSCFPERIRLRVGELAVEHWISSKRSMHLGQCRCPKGMAYFIPGH